MIKGISKKNITYPIKHIGEKVLGRDVYNEASEIIMKTVGSTLGPRGSNVIIREPNKDPFSTKDGATVFKHLKIEDEPVDMVLQIIKQSSEKTNESAGDGTTTTAILACLLMNNYNKYKQISGGNNLIENKYLFRTKLQEISQEHIVNINNNFSKVISSHEDIRRVATISGNNNDYIGNLISTAYELVGIHGKVMISTNPKLEDEIDVVEGIQFKSGYSTPFFISDHKKRTSDLKDPLILIYNGKINTLDGFLKPLQLAAEKGKPLVIISDELGGETLATLVANHTKNILSINNIVIPGLGSNRTDFIEDVSAITGAMVIDPDKGHNLNDFSFKHFGNASQVVSTKVDTNIIGGKGTEERIKERINTILVQIEESDSILEKDYHKVRLDKLSGKVALIKVGAFTQVEQREKMDMIEDALKSVKSSLMKGISLGGGYTYLNAFKHDGTIVSDIYLESIKDYIKILVNDSNIESKVIDSLKENRGYNLLTLEEGDLEDMGVIDSTYILTEVIKNTVSVVGTLLISGTIISPDLKSIQDPMQFM